MNSTTKRYEGGNLPSHRPSPSFWKELNNICLKQMQGFVWGGWAGRARTDSFFKFVQGKGIRWDALETFSKHATIVKNNNNNNNNVLLKLATKHSVPARTWEALEAGPNTSCTEPRSEPDQNGPKRPVSSPMVFDYHSNNSIFFGWFVNKLAELEIFHLRKSFMFPTCGFLFFCGMVTQYEKEASNILWKERKAKKEQFQN